MDNFLYKTLIFMILYKKLSISYLYIYKLKLSIKISSELNALNYFKTKIYIFSLQVDNILNKIIF